MKSTTLILLYSLLGLVFFTGCGQPQDLGHETEEKAFRRGERLLKEGLTDEALTAFLSVISSRPDAAESHLEAGLLYLNNLKDPLSAIYHFRYYLLLSPDSEKASGVEQLIQTAKKEFMRALPAEPFGPSVDKQDLLDRLELIEMENERLKGELIDRTKLIASLEKALQQGENQLAELQNRPPENRISNQVAPIVIGNNNAQQSSATVSKYTVVSGDTLSRISQKVYGSSTRWMDIFQANRDQLPSPNALKPGQELVIP